jgi:hypothetical protein
MAKQFFLDLGYHCPGSQTTADFLTSLTNPAERTVQPGAEKRVPKTPGEFADAWSKSHVRESLIRDIHAFNEEFPMDGTEAEKFKAVRQAQQASWT